MCYEVLLFLVPFCSLMFLPLNLAYNRSAHCTQVSDQCPLGSKFFADMSTNLSICKSIFVLYVLSIHSSILMLIITNSGHCPVCSELCYGIFASLFLIDFAFRYFHCRISFLARLHFSAEEILLYRRRPHTKC